MLSQLWLSSSWPFPLCLRLDWRGVTRLRGGPAMRLVFRGSLLEMGSSSTLNRTDPRARGKGKMWSGPEP